MTHQTDSKASVIIGAVTLVLAAAILIVVLMPEAGGPGLETTRAERARELANIYATEELYPQAIAAYERCIEIGSHDEKTEGNIAFKIADIYMNELRDYENAMAWYLRTRQVQPETSLGREASKKIIECLERLERSLDALHHLDRATAVNGTERVGGDIVVATIGEREIALSEVENLLEGIPPNLRPPFETPEERLSFVSQYIANEVLHNAAMRRGFDRDDTVLSAVEEAKKMAIIQKLVSEEIADKVEATESDLRLYYEAHKAEFSEKSEEEERLKGFEEVKPQVEYMLRAERRQELYRALLDRLMKAEGVRIHQERLQ